MAGRQWIGLAAALVALLAAAPTAAAQTFEGSSTFYAFHLQGSHGYEVRVLASAPEFPGEPAGLSIEVDRGGASASYARRASVTRDRIRADLGRLGRVDLSVRRSGEQQEAHVECSDLREIYEPVTLEGDFTFRGEGGFTTASATRVSSIPYLRVLGVCRKGEPGYNEQFGPELSGARLKGVSYAAGRILQFQLNKNAPEAPVRFEASLRERREGISIFRQAKGKVGAGSFTFGHSLRRATLNPSAPFSGTAVATRSPAAVSPLWSGDLAIDFPGRPSYPIAGPAVHVSLEHSRRTPNKGPGLEG